MACVCLTPFLGKAVHIDDPLFVWNAQHILRRPADFYGWEVNWSGFVRPMYEETQNPPLSCYYLALAVFAAGTSEIALHIAMLPITLAALTGVFVLAEEMGTSGWRAMLVAFFTPVFFVSSTTLMSDVPMLALWCWAIVCWRRGVRQRRGAMLVSAAVLISLAALTKYFALALVPLLAVYAWQHNGRPTRQLAWLAMPLVVLLGYEGVTYALYGKGLLSGAARYALEFGESGSAAATRPPATTSAWVGLVFMGGCLAPALVWSPWLLSKRAWGVIALFFVACVAALVQSARLGGFSLLNQGTLDGVAVAHAALFALCGALVLWQAVRLLAYWRDADTLLLALWLLGTFTFAALVNWTCNGRSILPMAPAWGILIAMSFTAWQPRRHELSWFAFSASALLAFAICWGDFCEAAAARRAAAALAEEFQPRAERLWFQGHWGFQYYAQRSAAVPVDLAHDRVAPSDWMLLPLNNTRVAFVPAQVCRQRERREFSGASWITTLSAARGVGFYSTIHGPLPWRLGPQTPSGYEAISPVQTLQFGTAPERSSAHPTENGADR